MSKILAMEEKKTIKCLNCGTEFAGKFCPECGQRADTKRFTIRFIFTNLLQAILSNDGGVWITLKSLFTRPGAMVIDILNGKRKSYFSPFPMLFLTLSLYIVIFSFTGSREYKLELNELTSKYSQSLEKVEETEAGQAKQTIIRHGLYVMSICKDHYTAVMVLTIPIYILAARACYGRKNRKKYNWGEYCIPVVYATIIVTLYRCISSICFAFSTKLYDFLDDWSWAVTVVAFSMCFKKMLEFSIAKTIWKSLVLFVFYWMTLFMLIIVFGILYVIIFYKNFQALSS